MPRYGLCLLLGAWALAACVTPAELRATPPVRVVSVPGAYLPLATCVAGSLEKSRTENGMTYQLVDTAATKTARLMATARFVGGLFYTVPAPLLELAFNQADEGNVKIEARRSFAGLDLESASWPVIEQCAGKKLSVTPSLAQRSLARAQRF
jgi:hypothetical protein